MDRTARDIEALEPDTEDTRIAVLQGMLRELEERAEYWRVSADGFRQRTGTVPESVQATLNAYAAEAAAFRWLMQRGGVRPAQAGE